MRSLISNRLAPVMIAAVAFGIAGSANAAAITSSNIGDTYISNASGVNLNTSRNSDFSVTSLNNSAQIWAKFSGAGLRTAIGTDSVDSLSLRFAVSVAVDNSALEFYYNSNAAWTLPASGTNATNQAAATTPYLTYNNSGQGNAANSRFLGTTQLAATFSFGPSTDVLYHVIDIPLTGDSMIRDAIASGSDFTIFALVVGAGRLNAVSTEGLQANIDTGLYGTQTVVPLTLVANTSAVPEPAAMSLLGLAGTTLLVRRRR